MPDEGLEDRRISYERAAIGNTLGCCYVVMEREKGCIYPALVAVCLSVEQACEEADDRTKKSGPGRYIVYEFTMGAGGDPSPRVVYNP